MYVVYRRQPVLELLVRGLLLFVHKSILASLGTGTYASGPTCFRELPPSRGSTLSYGHDGERTGDYHNSWPLKSTLESRRAYRKLQYFIPLARKGTLLAPDLV